MTVSPDVSVSTSLGGFINKTGVWGPVEETVYDAMEDSPLKWRVGPRGQHVEMGIAEMNLVLLLGQLGMTWDYQRERLLPIGTLYDPFVMRALEGIVFSAYPGARFVLVGTPSGISLSPRGRRPPVAQHPRDRDRDARDHLLRAGLRARARMAAPRRPAPACRSPTARRSTCGSRPSRSTRRRSPTLVARRGEEQVRADVVRGGFRLRDAAPADDRVLIATCGTMVPEALAAADQLAADEGVEATVLVLSSPDRLYRDWQRARTAPAARRADQLRAPTSRRSCAPTSAACRSSP